MCYSTTFALVVLLIGDMSGSPVVGESRKGWNNEWYRSKLLNCYIQMSHGIDSHSNYFVSKSPNS